MKAMTREEQLATKALLYDIDMQKEGKPWRRAADLGDGFFAGAKWADANPFWNLCEDRMPQDTNPVLVYSDGDAPDMAVAEYDFFKGGWVVYGCPTGMEPRVTAWMELPCPPTKATGEAV